MIQLACHEIEKGFGVYDILKGVTFEIQDEERVGIVGRNGAGKTTLLKILMGQEKQDKGELFIRKGAVLGYVEQMPHYDAHFTGLDVLKTAFKEQYALKEAIHQLEIQMATLEGQALEGCLKKYSRLSESFEIQGGYAIEEQLSRICTGLGLEEGLLNKGFTTLSGGEKTTLLLAKVLLQKPDILLLDEPTNHLDMKGMEWLEDYLKGYKGAVVMVSHDRYFLDQVADKMIDIEGGKATTYKGNYIAYCQEKEKNLLAEFEAYKEQQKKIKAMEKAIKRLRIWAAQGDNEDLFKKAASMQKRLDKMEKLERPTLEQAKIDLNFNETARSGKDVLKLQGLSKGYENKKLFEDLDFAMNYQERIALIGSNGCGKSTLIKIILGEVEPDAGAVKLGANLKIAYLPQQVKFPNEELTVLEALKEGITLSEEKARHILAKFLFYGESVFKKIKSLSGGEKSRLMLCKMVQQDVNMLLLDEPTNHLDIDSRENLEEALQHFVGSILVISHDRFFINQVVGRIVEIEEGHLTHYCGDYTYYREKKRQLRQEAETKKIAETKCVNETKVLKEKDIISKRKVIEEVVSPKATEGSQDGTKKENQIPQAQQDARATQIDNHEKRTKGKCRNEVGLKLLEDTLETYEGQLKVLQGEMEKVACDYEKWMALEREKQMIQEKMDQLMEKWMAMQN